MKAKNTAKEFLQYLNDEYHKLHKGYEELFWISYMGDHSVDNKLKLAQKRRDAFRANPEFPKRLKELEEGADKAAGVRIGYWLWFFSCYQTPPEGLAVKEKIDKLEGEIQRKRSTRKEGYTDPYTKKFVAASSNKMSVMMVTHNDEKVRKSCFSAKEKLAKQFAREYVELVRLRNRYARALGYGDFYEYKLRTVDRMSKREIFGIFDKIYRKIKYAEKNIAKLEKSMPGLRKPWNFGYMMSGNFIKEKDPYFQFDQAIIRWGQSFAALGIDFKGGTLKLDLLDRKGKYNNGFCHYPDLVRMEKGKLMPGSANFTCNMVYGQVGSGHNGYHTLFHEGGHAADRLNSEVIDVCMNHEFAPSSNAWAETHSMFLDTVFSSIEWASRYALDKDGRAYPFELFEHEIKKMHPLRPLSLNGMMMVSDFERQVYEAKTLTGGRVKSIARNTFKKYFDRSVPSHNILNIPHIYDFESSAYYHGYALATLILNQWREYFYKKYGYIVDNKKVGAEMSRVWKLASTKGLMDFVKMATGKPLSADAFLREVTMTLPGILKRAKSRIDRLKKVKRYTGPVKFNAKIHLVDGKKEIANNRKSFEDMAKKYSDWLSSERK
ncbi:M2 family metallopeptidase [Candidatus Parcubacteria bacterium]|nr:M2 family metallopeptidase [Candidatus Parcubacteria bacterium]